MMNLKNKENIKKTSKFILENRYMLSIVMIIISTILGFFTNSIGIKEWLSTTDKVLCLWWNIKFYTLLLASYELFLIFTNIKLAVAGTIVLSFSGFVQWNFNNIDALILGEVITVLIYKIIISENLKKNIVFSLAIILCFMGYVFSFRPFAVSFGYVFLAIIIFIFIRNRCYLKNNKKKIILFLSTFIISISSAIILRKIFHTYNGENLENISFGISGMFSYLYNFILPFYNFENRELLGSIISLFPLPICIALFYMYKNDKHVEFLLPLTIVSVFEIVLGLCNVSELITKVTMFSGINYFRIVPAIEFSNLLIMFYFLDNIDECLFNLNHSMRITVIMVCILVFIKFPVIFASKKFLYIFVCELTTLTFLFLNYKNKKYKKIFIFLLIAFTLIGGIPVNLIR